MRALARTLLGWCDEGVPFAVAEVVDVAGSAPLPPGACLAVNARGEAAGGVSGGCVESAVYELCHEVLASGVPVLERFDADPSDPFATALTCGGTIEVFVQAIAAGTAAYPAVHAALTEMVAGSPRTEPVALVRVITGPPDLLGAAALVRADGTTAETVHTDMGDTTIMGTHAAAGVTVPATAVRPDGTVYTSAPDTSTVDIGTVDIGTAVPAAAVRRAAGMLAVGATGTVTVGTTGEGGDGGAVGTTGGGSGSNGGGDGGGGRDSGGSGYGGRGGGNSDPGSGSGGSDDAGGGAVCGVPVRAFVESSVPAPRMVILGAVDHAAALVRVGRLLGYRITVCDARPVFATAARFPDADEVVVAWPDAYLASTPVDGRTVVCVLTHDPKFDVPALTAALRLPVAFVGAMGSRRTCADRAGRLRAAGVTEHELARLHAPIGLDLGAVTPEETAVSIAAEIVAAARGGSGSPLTSTTGPIHRTNAAHRPPTGAGVHYSPAL